MTFIFIRQVDLWLSVTRIKQTPVYLQKVKKYLKRMHLYGADSHKNKSLWHCYLIIFEYLGRKKSRFFLLDYIVIPNWVLLRHFIFSPPVLPLTPPRSSPTLFHLLPTSHPLSFYFYSLTKTQDFSCRIFHPIHVKLGRENPIWLVWLRHQLIMWTNYNSVVE